MNSCNFLKPSYASVIVEKKSLQRSSFDLVLITYFHFWVLYDANIISFIHISYNYAK